MGKIQPAVKKIKIEQNKYALIKMQTEDDGYHRELQTLQKILNIYEVELPDEPLRELERFRRDFKDECQRNKVNYSYAQVDGQWLSLSEQSRAQYRKSCERELHTFTRLQELKMLLASSKQNGSYLNYHKEQSKALKSQNLNNELTQAQIADNWKALTKAQKDEYAQKIRLNPLDKQELQKEYIDLKEQYERDHAEVPKQIVFFDKSKGKENIEKGNQIDDVDMIIGLRKRQGKKEYLVRWKGKTGADATWVTKKWLKPLKEMVRFFHESYYSQHFEGDSNLLFNSKDISSGFSSTPIFQEDDLAKSIVSRPKSQISKVSKVSKESIQQKQQPFKPQVLIPPVLAELPLPKPEIHNQNQVQAEPTQPKVVKDPKPEVQVDAQEEHKSDKEIIKSSKNKNEKHRAKILEKNKFQKLKENNKSIISKLRSQSKAKPEQSQNAPKSIQDIKSKKNKKTDKLKSKLEIKQKIVADVIPEPIVKTKSLASTKFRASQPPVSQSQQDQTQKLNKKQESKQQLPIKNKPDRLDTILTKKGQSQITKFTTKITTRAKQLGQLHKVQRELKHKKPQEQPTKKVIPKKIIFKTKNEIRQTLERIIKGRETRTSISQETKIQPPKAKKQSIQIIKPVKEQQQELKSQNTQKKKIVMQINTRAILAKKAIPLIVKSISKKDPVVKTRSQVRRHLGD